MVLRKNIDTSIMFFFSPWCRRRKAWPPQPRRGRPQPGRQWSSWWCSAGTSPWPLRGWRGHYRTPRRYRAPTPAGPSSSCRRKKNQEPRKSYFRQVENFHSVHCFWGKFDLTFSHSVVWEDSLSQEGMINNWSKEDLKPKYREW